MFMHTFAPLMDPSLSIVHQEGAKRRRRPRPEAEQLERGMAKRERGREKRGRSGKYGFWVPKGTSARPSPSVPPSPPAGYRGRLNIVMETTILCISGKVRRWSKEEEEDKCCIGEMWVKYICYELAPLHLSLFTPLLRCPQEKFTTSFPFYGSRNMCGRYDPPRSVSLPRSTLPLSL